MNEARVVTVTISYVIDADGADLLPGWPGSMNGPGDDSDPPISGVEMAMQSAVDRQTPAIEEALPTTLGAVWMSTGIEIGPRLSRDPNF